MVLTVELGSFAALSDDCTDTLQDVLSLIAYPDPLSSPVSHYLSQDRREQVATELNNHIIGRAAATHGLAWHGGNTWTGLERLAQQSTVVRDLLHSEGSKDVKSQKVFSPSSPEMVYPKWSLPIFLI
ncbi:hypothetical protein HDU91_003602 [Kappamyces sp. JEL0680]|nr:hypothetical protein HDU91_003602 [Kappamyces sp. JEL0680]